MYHSVDESCFYMSTPVFEIEALELPLQTLCCSYRIIPYPQNNYQTEEDAFAIIPTLHVSQKKKNQHTIHKTEAVWLKMPYMWWDDFTLAYLFLIHATLWKRLFFFLFTPQFVFMWICFEIICIVTQRLNHSLKPQPTHQDPILEALFKYQLSCFWSRLLLMILGWQKEKGFINI